MSGSAGKDRGMIRGKLLMKNKVEFKAELTRNEKTPEEWKDPAKYFVNFVIFVIQSYLTRGTAAILRHNIQLSPKEESGVKAATRKNKRITISGEATLVH